MHLAVAGGLAGALVRAVSASRAWIPATAFALAGAALLVWLVQRTDPVELLQALRRGAAWVPVLVAIEGARIAIEAWGGRNLYAKAIPFPLLLRATLVTYAIAALAPAGRAAGEAAKAGILRNLSSLSDTAAAATTLQTSSLLGLGVWSLVCTIVATGVSLPMAGTFAVQTAVVLLGVAIVRGASRTRGLGRLVGHFWPKARERLDAVRVHASKQHLGRPVLAFTLSRGLELIQYGVIFLAVTGHFALVPVVLSLGVATVAGTLGDAVPVQLGVIGASFAAASGILGISGADAVAFGALAHAFQLAWIAVGLVTPLVWRVRQ